MTRSLEWRRCSVNWLPTLSWSTCTAFLCNYAIIFSLQLLTFSSEAGEGAMPSPMLFHVNVWRVLTKSEPYVIVPASCFIASVTWEIEERVWVAIENQPGPSSCLPDQQTCSVLQQCFWWPSMEEVCQNKSATRARPLIILPAGLLYTLLAPLRTSQIILTQRRSIYSFPAL